MSKIVTVSTKVDEEIHKLIVDSSEELEVTMSEWLQTAIFCYGCWLSDSMDLFENDYGYNEEGYCWEDLEDMDWEELAELVDSEELDVDPTDHRGFLTKDEESFRDAVGEALGLEFDEADQEDED